MKKKWLLILPVIIVLFVIGYLVGINIMEEDDVMDAEERRRMYFYIRDNLMQGDDDSNNAISALGSDYRIVFVMSPEYRDDFPDDVVLWPSEATYRFLDAYNRLVLFDEIDLTLFSLEYPLTIENIVYDWEKVFDLLYVGNRFGGFDRHKTSLMRSTGGEWPPADAVSEEFLPKHRMHIYAEFFRLEDDVNRRTSLHFVFPGLRESFSEMVFVADSEEREHFPDDVLVLWPTGDTESILEAVNRLVIIEEIDLSRFSLEYPITLSNVLDDWEDVRAMLFVGANAGGVSVEGRWRIDDSRGRWPTEEDVLDDSE